MAYVVKDFADILDAIREDLKIQETDTETMNRIERCVNMAFMDVIDFKRWPWMSGHTKVVHKAVYQDDDCSVTPDSATVTLNSAPSVGLGSFAGYKFKTSSNPEIYTISAHTAGSTTVTLTSTYQGELEDEQDYKIWREEIDLPTDCKEVIEVWHDHNRRQTMEGLGRQEFRRRQNESATYEGRPHYFYQTDYHDPTSGTAETESDRYRRLMLHPSIYTENTTIHVDYNKEITFLDADGDEPPMPLEHRNVLVFGGLMYAWGSIMRNEEAAAKWERKFYDKLSRMAGKVEDGFDKPQLIPDSRYMLQKRAKRAGRRVRGAGYGNSAGSTYTSPTYLANVTINGARVTGNITVDSGITIDGIDVSALSAEVDTLQALSSGQIFVGNSSNVTTAVTPSGDVTISNAGVTAIAAGAIEDTDVNASAAIARSKLASGTADHVVINSAAGAFSSEEALSPVRGGTGVANNAAATLTRSGNHALTLTTTGTTNVTLPTSGTLITGTGSSTDNAIVRNDGTGGAIQTSTVTIGDTGAIENILGANVVGLKIQQFSGATANLSEWYNSSSSRRAYVTTNGTIQAAAFTIADDLAGFNNDRFTVPTYATNMTWSSGSSNPAWSLTGSNGSQDFLTMMQITANKAGNRALIVKGAGSQSANLFESRNSSDAVLNYVASNGVFQADAGFGAKRTTTATDYTVLITDYFVGVTSNAAARTITLPAANTCKAGQIFIIKDEAGTAASANNITIARAGSDTIDGATSITISADYGVLRLYSNGSNGFFSF